MRGVSSGRFGVEFSEPVRDPVWKDVYLPAAFLPILESAPFVKLMGIRQLGPAYLAYPGATHTRFSHSIGVFEMARRTLAELFSKYELPYVTRTGAVSFLAAALCHDIGHFPFAHSLKELPLREHEALTADRVLEAPLKPLLKAAGADPEIVAATVDFSRPDGRDPQVSLFRRLLSGTLDPDKLDYLTRDAFFCGVPYGIQDTDYVLRHLTLAPGDMPGIDDRGVMSVENLLFSKYSMYRSVYWHRKVRAATAMVKKSVESLLSSGRIREDDLYDLDDSGFQALVEGAGGEEALPALLAFRGELYGTAFETPFDPEIPGFEALRDLGRRSDVETRLCRALHSCGLDVEPFEVIVDLPEPVTFESDLPVVSLSGAGMSTGSVPFGASSTVFRPSVVDAFVRSLRIVRVFLPERILSASEGKMADELGRVLTAL